MLANLHFHCKVWGQDFFFLRNELFDSARMHSMYQTVKVNIVLNAVVM